MNCSQPCLQQLLESADPCWIKAGWLWTGTEPFPVSQKYLLVEQGVLTDITDTPPDRYFDFRSGFFIPPLVNAHCHLEFSHLAEPLPSQPSFADWISATVKIRRENDHVQQSIIQGIAELKNNGTGYVAEIQTQDLHCYPQQNPLAGWLFREVIAFNEEQLKTQLEQCEQAVKKTTATSTNNGWQLGLSPHAPYTVCPDNLASCVELAARFQLPVTMHLAETEAERNLVEHHRGELVEMLDRLELWRPQHYPAGTRLLDYLELLQRAPRVLIAHGNYFQQAEIERIARSPQMSVVYCPRTHAYFGHTIHPWQKMVDLEIPLALGTDGRGSNPDLNLWREVQFLAGQFPQKNPLAFLQMATVNGAAALLAKDTTIRVGSRLEGNVLFPALTQTFSDWKDFFYQPVRAEFVMLRR